MESVANSSETTTAKPGNVPASIAGVSTSVTAFIGISRNGPLLTAAHVGSFAQYQSEFGPLDAQSEMGFAAFLFFENGGTSVYIVRAGAIGDALDEASAQDAFQALDKTPILNLLCLPGIIEPAVLAAARGYCEKRGAFLIIDADPKAATAEQFASLLNGAALPRSLSAAIYGPWVEISNPLGGGGLRATAPSGLVAAVYAKTDGSFGVWKTPAGVGTSLVGVAGLTATLRENETSDLQKLGLNLIRFTAPEGFVIWGARTLAHTNSGTEWEYVPVRRLALYLEASITQGIRWAVFEPNGPELWAQLRLQVSAFLEKLFRQGAFQGSTAAEAFFVKCDNTTMTQTDIDQGLINVVVGFAPLKPAEFIIFRIQEWVRC